MNLKNRLETQTHLSATDKLIYTILKRLCLVEAQTAFDLSYRPQYYPEWSALATDIVREVDALALLIAETFKPEFQKEYRSISAQKKFAVDSAQTTMGLAYKKGKNNAPYENYKNALPGCITLRNDEIVKKLDLPQDIRVALIATLLKETYRTIDDTKLNASISRLELKLLTYKQAAVEELPISSRKTEVHVESMSQSDAKISGDESIAIGEKDAISLVSPDNEGEEVLFPVIEVAPSDKPDLVASQREEELVDESIARSESDTISLVNPDNDIEESGDDFEIIDIVQDTSGNLTAVLVGLHRFSLHSSEKHSKLPQTLPLATDSFAMGKKA